MNAGLTVTAKLTKRNIQSSQEEIVKTEQAMSQTEPTMDTADQHFESENRDATLKEQLVKLTQERDVYKKKLEEFETHLEEAKVGIPYLLLHSLW